MGHELKILDWLLSGLGVAFAVWLFYRALQRSESPGKIIAKALFTLVLLGGGIFFIHRSLGSLHEGGIEANAYPALLIVVSVAIAAVVLSAIWTPHIGDLLVGPLADLFDGGHQPPEPRPAYSSAQSKRRQSRPLEAIVAIREQLAQFPNDFEGVMLLATIQAVDMDDLSSAEITLTRFSDASGVPEKESIKALTQLAEWHLEKDSDSDAVLEIMKTLMMRFPEAKISRRIAERWNRLQDGEDKQNLMAEMKSAASAATSGRKIVPNLANKRRT